MSKKGVDNVNDRSPIVNAISLNPIFDKLQGECVVIVVYFSEQG